MRAIARIFLTCLLAVVLLALMGCGGAASQASKANQAPSDTMETGDSLPEKEGVSIMKENRVEIHIGNQRFSVILEDNPSARALAERMPLDITMTELNGNEKYYRFSERLPSNDQQIGQIHAGDLMLYDSSYVVLFYKDFATSYRYTRLGHIEHTDGLREAVDSGDIRVKIHHP